MANSPKFCSNCGSAVERGAHVCQVCGARLPAGRLAADEPVTQPPARRTWQPALIACASLVGVTVLVIGCLAASLVLRLNEGLPDFVTRWLSTPFVEEIVQATEAATDTAVPTRAPATATATASPTQPVKTPVPTLPDGTAANVIYGGIRFYLDPAVARGVNSQTLPANPPSGDNAWWEISPEHTQFTLSNYVLQGMFHNPQIFVYPVEQFAQMSEQAAKNFNDLRSLLSARPQQIARLPFLPNWNAGQMMHARMEYLNFRSGSGVRYLSQYGQGLSQVNNRDIFYTFQGLTRDGKYYIAVVLPINNPVLPATADMQPAEYETFAKNYEQFMADAVAKLESQPDGSFQPTLGVLDALVKSIEIQE